MEAQSCGNPPARWFINMCKHRLIDLPIAYSGKPVCKDFILTHGIGSMQVPFDAGSFRKLKARSDGAKQTTYCIDVVFNPLIVQLFMDDAFCTQKAEFRSFVMNLAMKRIEESVGVKLDTNSVKLVKTLRYKDPEDDEGTAREFTELPGDQDSFDAELRAPAPRQEKPEEPLITDLSPEVPKKSSIKKGFLNKAGGSLYGDSGSKEGILPENAGDPMGWMPKKLRNTCKIVDCNAPEYQENERKRRDVEEHNSMQKEFKDTLGKDMEKWTKKMQPDRWGEDLPDGEGANAPAEKYSNDYSRFDKIEVDDETVVEKRDWYYDSNGQRVELNKPQAQLKEEPKPTGKENQEGAIKKGFLEASKKPLYPKGSEQKAPLSEKELVEQFQKEFGNDLPEDLSRLLPDGESLGKPPAVGAKTSTVVKRPELAMPEFSLSEVSDGPDGALLRLVVEVPNLESMQGVDMDITERRATISFPPEARLRPLQVELKKAVVPTAVKAKFSRKTKQITASLPLA